MQEDLFIPSVSDDEIACTRVKVRSPDDVLGSGVAIVKIGVVTLFDVGLVVVGALYIFPNGLGNAKGPAHIGAIRSFFQRVMEAGDEFDRSLEFLAFEHRNQGTYSHHTTIARFHHHQALLLFRNLHHRVTHLGHIHLRHFRVVRPIKQRRWRGVEIHLGQVMALFYRFIKFVQVLPRFFAVTPLEGLDQFIVQQQHIGTQTHCAVSALHELLENHFELLEVRFGQLDDVVSPGFVRGYADKAGNQQGDEKQPGNYPGIGFCFHIGICPGSNGK